MRRDTDITYKHKRHSSYPHIKPCAWSKGERHRPRLQTQTHAHSHTHTHARWRARTRARTHTHTPLGGEVGQALVAAVDRLPPEDHVVRAATPPPPPHPTPPTPPTPPPPPPASPSRGFARDPAAQGQSPASGGWAGGREGGGGVEGAEQETESRRAACRPQGGLACCRGGARRQGEEGAHSRRGRRRGLPCRWESAARNGTRGQRGRAVPRTCTGAARREINARAHTHTTHNCETRLDARAAGCVCVGGGEQGASGIGRHLV